MRVYHNARPRIMSQGDKIARFEAYKTLFVAWGAGSANPMRKLFKIGVATLIATGLTGASRIQDQPGAGVYGLGYCLVGVTYAPADGFAGVYLYSLSADYSAGGSVWLFGSKNRDFSSITTEVLASCLGLAPSSVVHLMQTGADAPTLKEEDYIGFTFTTTERSRSHSLLPGTYTYSIPIVSTLDAKLTLEATPKSVE